MQTNFHTSFKKPVSTKLGTFITKKMLTEICNRNSILVVSKPRKTYECM